MSSSGVVSEKSEYQDGGSVFGIYHSLYKHFKRNLGGHIGQLTKESVKWLGFVFSIGPYVASDSQIAITVQFR